jgi:hypothetical protein
MMSGVDETADFAEPRLAEGWVAPEVHEEFPELRLRSLGVPRNPHKTPPEIRERLRALSDRFRGAQAVALRRAPINSAYRVFFRHVGLDPDTTRTPAEEAAVARLVHGGFRHTNLLDDALLIALIETGIPLWAVDADRVSEPLGIGTGGDGRLSVLDQEAVIATLFGPVRPAFAAGPKSERLLLYSIQVPGVPGIFVEEAMWLCLGVLETEG